MRVELGCGLNKRLEGSVTIDILNLPGVDIVADLNNGLPFLGDNSVDEIYSHHVLEHLTDLPKFMEEVFRVLKPTGVFWGEVPHFSNPYYYSDPTHNLFFGLYTFNYFSKRQDAFKRKVPAFYVSTDFCIEKYQLVFRSATKSKVRSFLNHRLSLFFNKNLARQELFEAIFARVIGCYELRFWLRKP